MRPFSFWRPRVEQEVQDELDFHLEARTRDLIAQGIDPVAARVEAARRLGERAALTNRLEALGKERDSRKARREWWSEFTSDTLVAWRSWRKSPWAAVAVIGSLALGIGGSVATYGLVYAVLQKPLPFPDDRRLVAVEEEVPNSDQPFELAYPTFEDLGLRFRSFERTGGYSPTALTFRDGEETPELNGAQVTGGFFLTLGTSASMGRTLAYQDDSAGAKVAVVSDRFWRTRMGRRADPIGATISLGNEPYVVVGVMPPRFRFPNEETDFWLPFGPAQDWMRNRAVHIVRAIARLRLGVDLATAATESRGVMGTIQADEPGKDPGHAFLIVPLKTFLVGDARPIVLVLFGGVFALLILTCGNVSALMLSRAATRLPEMAVRAALGAGRARLTRLVLTEATVLAAVGGVIGLGVAYGAAHWLASQLVTVPRVSEMGPAAPIVGFGFAITLGVGILVGLAPVWLARPSDGRAALGMRVTTSHHQRRLHQFVVLTQLALTVALLVGSTAVARSFIRITKVEPGFRTTELLLARVSLPSSFDGARVVDYYRDLPERLGRIPGVITATATSTPPLNGGDSYGIVTAEGLASTPGSEPSASFRRVLPNFFQAAGVPLVSGRDFNADDKGDRGLVVIISHAMATTLWPNGSALGRRIKIGPPEGEPWLTVIGVVGDVRNVALDAPTRWATYEPHSQRPRRTMTVLVRTKGDPTSVIGPVRAAIREPDQSIPVFGITTMEQLINQSLAPRRFHVSVLVVFGLVALGLALLGVVGLSQFTAGLRRREFGLRSALGATPGSLVRIGLVESVTLTAAGLGLGLAISVAGSRLIGRLLVDTSAVDPGTLVGVGLVLSTAALLAAYGPVHRAARVAPMTTLRDE